MDSTTLPPCDWPVDDDGIVRLGEIDLSERCRIEPRVMGFGLAVVDLDSTSSSEDTSLSDQGVRASSAWRKRAGAPTAVEVTTMGETEQEPQLVAMADEASPTMASQPIDAAMPDLSAFLPKDGHVSSLTVLLIALVLLAGIAYRFGPAWVRSHHEREMRRLELEEKKVDRDDSHEKCSAERKQLAARVDQTHDRLGVIEQRIGEAEGKLLRPFSFGEEDVEQLRDDLRKVQKMVKASRAKVAAAKTKKRGA